MSLIGGIINKFMTIFYNGIDNKNLRITCAGKFMNYNKITK